MTNKTTAGAAGTVTAKRQSNPEGRVDILACRLLDHVMGTHPGVSPIGAALYRTFKSDIEVLARRTVGPRTKAGRTIKGLIARVKQDQQGQRRGALA